MMAARVAVRRTAPTSGTLARREARVAGLLYLGVIVGGGFAQGVVRQRLFVPGDPSATARNVVAHEDLLRWAFVADLMPLLFNVLLAVILFGLFKVVSTRIATLAILFSLIGTAIQSAVLIFHIAPVFVLNGGAALDGLTEPQSQALAYLMLRLQTDGYTLALVFFGCFGLCLGYLIVRSAFLPRTLGVLMGIAGFCYFANSLAYFVAPSLSSIAFLVPVLLGEGGLTLWLLFAGVNAARWEERARAAS